MFLNLQNHKFRKLFGGRSEPDESFPRTLGGVKKTNLNNIREDDIIVLVLGQSGSGKSTFITKTVGCDVGVGHGLDESKTKSITLIRVMLAHAQYKGDLILVDTPGIELGEGSKEEDMILNWCKQARHRKLTIFGALYFTKPRGIIWDIPVGALSWLIDASKEHQFPEKVVFVLSMEERNMRQLKAAKVKKPRATKEKPGATKGEPGVDTKGSKQAANKPEENTKQTGEDVKEVDVDEKQDEVDEKQADVGEEQSEGDANKPEETKKQAGVEKHDEVDERRLEEDANRPERTAGQGGEDVKQAMEDEKQTKESEKQDANKPEGTTKQAAKEPEVGPIQQQWHEKQGPFKRMQFSGTTKSALEIMQSITPFTPDRRGVRPKDIVIAVMGPTGSGKSTFISTIANDSAEIGHNLQSCTNSVNLIRAPGHTPFEGERVFVDTPGFDDTHLSDVDILKMIADWLNKSYGDGVRLSGLLYFHRISDNRMAGTPLKNLRMFQELCGKDMFQSIILVTTMWDDVDEDTGTSRETELVEKYWGGMISLGSRTARFYRTEASALDVIDPLVEASMDSSRALAKDTILLLQREMNLLRQQLPETSAGQQLISKLELLLSRRRDLLARISGDVAESRAEGDEDSVEILMQELEKLQQQMASTMQEMDRMALPQKNLSRLNRLLHRINPIRG